MRRHKDAVLAALFGFTLTTGLMAPPILNAHAAQAARIAAHDAALGPNAANLGKDRAGRLAAILREGGREAKSKEE